VSRVRRIGGALALLGTLAAAPAGAQDGADALTLAPIECRWRASASAVRVGEPFTVVLTCSVLETASTSVVPDRSRLDPSVVDLQPFEVVGGRTSQDLTTPGYVHFQYEYDTRYFGELFGADVPVPALDITYRVQSRLESGETIEGREQQYVMPPLPLRIVTLLPDGAVDIREPAPPTFADVEAQRFRARVLDVVGLVLLSLGAIAAAWAVAGLARRPGTRTARAARLASDAAVLRAAAADLAALRTRRHAEGWSPAMAARALAALRVAASVETGRPVAQVSAPPGATPVDGQLALTAGLPPRRVWVSGSATARTVATERARREATGAAGAARLGALDTALSAMTAAAYAREGDLPETGLDEAVDSGEAILRALAREHLAIVRGVRTALDTAVHRGRKAWAR
jgi:hypothetical protein